MYKLTKLTGSLLCVVLHLLIVNIFLVCKTGYESIGKLKAKLLGLPKYVAMAQPTPSAAGAAADDEASDAKTGTLSSNVNASEGEGSDSDLRAATAAAEAHKGLGGGMGLHSRKPKGKGRPKRRPLLDEKSWEQMLQQSQFFAAMEKRRDETLARMRSILYGALTPAAASGTQHVQLAVEELMEMLRLNNEQVIRETLHFLLLE